MISLFYSKKSKAAKFSTQNYSFNDASLLFKRHPHKIVKLKQFLAKADELFECVWPFCGVGA